MENGSIFPYCRRTTKTDGVTQKGRPAPAGGFKGVGSLRRKIHGGVFPRPDDEGSGPQSESIPGCQEKPLRSALVTVPQTDTGRRGENPKALVRTLV